MCRDIIKYFDVSFMSRIPPQHHDATSFAVIYYFNFFQLGAKTSKANQKTLIRDQKTSCLFAKFLLKTRKLNAT